MTRINLIPPSDRLKKKLSAARARGLYGVSYRICCKTCGVRRWYLNAEGHLLVYTTREVAARPRAQRTKAPGRAK